MAHNLRRLFVCLLPLEPLDIFNTERLVGTLEDVGTLEVGLVEMFASFVGIAGSFGSLTEFVVLSFVPSRGSFALSFGLKKHCL
jgi:hypothetical protein